MPSKGASAPKTARITLIVSPETFRQVYDSPHSLPGKFRWVTAHADVRIIEKLLGMVPKTIGVPLWVSGDTHKCGKCGWETNWLDSVSFALAKTHQRELLVRVILGEKKYVNIEAPNAIADLHCYQCQTPIHELRSFKCHNWAYARTELLEQIEKAARAGE